MGRVGLETFLLRDALSTGYVELVSFSSSIFLDQNTIDRPKNVAGRSRGQTTLRPHSKDTLELQHRSKIRFLSFLG